MKSKSEIFNSYKTMVDGKEVLTYGNAIKAMEELEHQFRQADVSGSLPKEVLFCDWVNKNYYETGLNGDWRKNEDDGSGKRFSTKELYDIYIGNDR